MSALNLFIGTLNVFWFYYWENLRFLIRLRLVAIWPISSRFWQSSRLLPWSIALLYADFRVFYQIIFFFFFFTHFYTSGMNAIHLILSPRTNTSPDCLDLLHCPVLGSIV